jgi:hypothetical protein
MSATSQALESNAASRPGLAGLISTGEQIVKLKTPQGVDSGIAIKFQPFDGETKLRHSTRISEANILRGHKKIEAINGAYVKLFKQQYIETLNLTPAELESMGGDPLKWFTTNPEGIVLMKIAVDSYYGDNVAEAESDAGN